MGVCVANPQPTGGKKCSHTAHRLAGGDVRRLHYVYFFVSAPSHVRGEAMFKDFYHNIILINKENPTASDGPFHVSKALKIHF